MNGAMRGGRDGDVEVRASVAMAIERSDADARLVAALRDAGFDVDVIGCIDGIADLAVDEAPLVAIVDDHDPHWLRKLNDLVRRRPTVRVLAMVEIANPEEFLTALGAGAAGFVPPTAEPAAIVRSVSALLDDGVAIPRRMVPALVDVVRHGRGRSVRTAAGWIDLTEREWEILQLLLQRRSTREMAELLFVSVGTVRSHISVLLKKLGAVDRDDAIRMVERGSS